MGWQREGGQGWLHRNGDRAKGVGRVGEGRGEKKRREQEDTSEWFTWWRKVNEGQILELVSFQTEWESTEAVRSVLPIYGAGQADWPPPP